MNQGFAVPHLRATESSIIKHELEEQIRSLNPGRRCCALIQTDNRFISEPVWSGLVQTCHVKDKVQK